MDTSTFCIRNTLTYITTIKLFYRYYHSMDITVLDLAHSSFYIVYPNTMETIQDMIYNRLYSIAVIYFLVFVVLLFVSGVWLWLLEMDIDISNITKPKSIEGIIEIVSPHIIAMGLMLFVLSHFLLSSTKFTHSTSLRIFLALSIVILLDQSAYLFIFIGWEIFGWVKVVSLLVYGILLSLLVWMLLVSL